MSARARVYKQKMKRQRIPNTNVILASIYRDPFVCEYGDFSFHAHTLPLKMKLSIIFYVYNNIFGEKLSKRIQYIFLRVEIFHHARAIKTERDEEHVKR